MAFQATLCWMTVAYQQATWKPFPLVGAVVKKKIPDVTNACRCQPQIFHVWVFVASSHFLLFVEVFQTCCWRPLISLSICLCKKFNPNAEAFDLLQIASAWMGPLLPISINSLDQTVTILAVEFNDTRNETMVGQKLL